MRRRLAFLMAVLVVLIAPACSDDDDNDSGGGATTSTTGTGSTVQVVQRDFSFDTEALEVPAGGTTVRVVNEGQALHTFTVDSLGIDQQVAPGSQVDVEVKAPAGEVPFYCRFHRSQGMEGTVRAKV